MSSAPDDRDEKIKRLGVNPSPIGTQQNPVSDPTDDDDNPVAKELRERERFLKEQDSKEKGA